MSIDQYTKPWYAFWNMVNHPEFKEILLDCFYPFEFKKLRSLLEPREWKMKLGWETLVKYASYFPESRFFLYTQSRKDNEIIDLRIVDKVKLIAIVREYSEDFQPVLQELAIEIDDLENNKQLSLFLQNLHHNGLFGTLLGFGRDNAWLFYQCRGMNPAERPMVSAWVEEEMENLERLNQKVISLKPWELSDLFYPRFACDPESYETKMLKKTYREEREQIIHYFEKQDLVEAVLTLFGR